MNQEMSMNLYSPIVSQEPLRNATSIIASAAPGYPGRDDAAGLVSTFALRDFLEDAATGTDAGRRYVRAWTREPGGPVRRNASRAELARLRPPHSGPRFEQARFRRRRRFGASDYQLQILTRA